MKILRELCWATESSVIAFAYHSPTGQYPHHYHPEVELILITAGHGKFMAGDYLGAYQPGHLALLGANLPHSYSPSGSAMVLQFDPALGDGMLDHLPELRGLRQLLDRARRGLSFSPATSRRVSPLFKRLIKTKGPSRIILLLQILDLLASARTVQPLASAPDEAATDTQNFERIERVCAWIHDNFQEHLTLKEAARLAHMTPTSFSRFFHRVTHTTFIRFVSDARVAYACRLLLDTNKSITEIAFASGFGNLANFHRRFRESRGTTPLSYRLNTIEMEKQKYHRPCPPGSTWKSRLVPR